MATPTITISLTVGTDAYGTEAAKIYRATALPEVPLKGSQPNADELAQMVLHVDRLVGEAVDEIKRQLGIRREAALQLAAGPALGRGDAEVVD